MDSVPPVLAQLTVLIGRAVPATPTAAATPAVLRNARRSRSVNSFFVVVIVSSSVIWLWGH